MSYDREQEADLVRKAQQGDQEAFAQLWKSLEPRLRADCKRQIGDKLIGMLDIDDLLAWSRHATFEYVQSLSPKTQVPSFFALALRVLRNDIQDARKRKGTQLEIRASTEIGKDDDEMVLTLFDVLSAKRDTPSRVARRRETLERLRQAIDDLPARDKRVIQGWLAGKRLSEMAQEEGLHPDSVSRVKQQVIEQLRIQLGGLSKNSVRGRTSRRRGH